MRFSVSAIGKTIIHSPAGQIEILPQRRDMQSLDELSTKKHLRNNLKGEQLHIKAFSRQMKYSILLSFSGKNSRRMR